MYSNIFLNLRHCATLCLLFLSFWAAAQQNQKIIYPNPAGATSGSPRYLLATPDGGWLLAGEVTSSVLFSWYTQPRLLKTDGLAVSQWDRTYLPPVPPRGVTARFSSVVNAPDGGWLCSIDDDSTGIDLLRVSADGTQQWTKNISNSLTLLGHVNGFYYGYSYKWQNGGYVATLYRLNADGSIAGSVVLPPVVLFVNNGNDLCLTSDGQLQMLSTQKSGSAFISKLTRFTLDGTLLWTSATFPYAEGGIEPDADGGVILLNGKKFSRYNAQGTLLNTSPANPLTDVQTISSFAGTPDGGIVIGGQTVTMRGVLGKLAPDYSVAWLSESPDDGQSPVKNIISALPTPDGWGIGLGQTADQRFALVRITANTGIQAKTVTGRVVRDFNNNCIAETTETGLKGTSIVAKSATETFYGFSQNDGSYTIKVPPGDYVMSARPAEQFFFTCTTANNIPLSLPVSAPASSSLDFPIQSLAVIHQIKGTVRIDNNNNCTTEASDNPAHRWWVTAEGSGFRRSAMTDADGQYSIWMPNGTYTVTASPLNPNYGFCSASTAQVTFNNTQAEVVTTDFLANAKTNCAFLKAFAQNNTMRPCTTTTVQIWYNNSGTRKAENATVTVVLDPALTYQSSSITPVSVQGNTLVFNVGTVEPSADYRYWSFNIQVLPSCSLQIGQQVCVSASIQGSGNCGNAPQWNGAIVAVSGKCLPGQNESVFYIKNIGNAPNSQTLEYIVAEDQIVLRSGTFQLAPQDSISITVPSSPNAQTIVAQQEPGYPGDTIVTYTLNNCVGMGGTSGHSGGFNGNAGPFTQQRCFNVSNSYDPNDKQAWPLGYGPKQIVSPGTTLEYTIRFQNTGNDTAFLVVIRDTLPETLSARSIEPLSSSHPYRMDLFENRILQYTFDHIRLPDSTTNAAGSQGYVKFAIRPRANLPLGTAIRNRAAIYFDYNAPIITNTVLRTIDRYFEVSSTHNPGNLLPVQVFPNPAQYTAWLQLPEGFVSDQELTFALMNSSGQLLQTARFTGRQYEMQCADLPEGLYFWQISKGNRRIASGKVVKQ